MKKVISFIGILGLAVLLSGCDYQVPTQPNDAVSPDDNNQIEQQDELNDDDQDPQANLEDEDDDVVNNNSNSKVNVEDIRKAFTKKYPDINYSKHTITIENDYENKFTEGGVGAPEGGGAHYWAAKVNGEWLIVAEAQDSLACSVFEPYDFPTEMTDDCFSEEVADDSVNSYEGLIKKYPDEEVAGDVAFYLELANGTKKNIKICDKRVMKLNNQIILLADTETKVSIYSDRAERNTLCVNGMAVELSDTNTKYTGVVKELPGGGFGGYANYIELEDGTQKQLQICDKRITGIWDTVIGMEGSNEKIDIYSTPSPDNNIDGLCVNGVAVNL